MKRIILLLGFGVLAGTIAFAQDAAGSSASTDSQDQTAQRTQSSTTSTNVIRGCLSGSTGNYTVTDPNGRQYEVNGDDATLRSMVGREVEITVSEDRSSDDSTHASGTSAHTSNAVQATNVRAVAGSCSKPAGAEAPSGSSATQDERPAPQMMARLQQQSAPGRDNALQNGSATPPQATPPVTSQTPATSASPTQGTNLQVGTSNAGTTAPNSAAPSPNAQQSQANCVQTKPLYECQATDLPWANSSGGSNGTPPSH